MKIYWFVIYQIKDRIYHAVVGLDKSRGTTDEYKEDIRNQCMLDYNFDIDLNYNLDTDSECNDTEYIHPYDVIIWYIDRLYLDINMNMKFINCPSKMPIG